MFVFVQILVTVRVAVVKSSANENRFESDKMSLLERVTNRG